MGHGDIVVLWVCGFCGDSHRFFRGYEMGMGIEINPHGSSAKSPMSGMSLCAHINYSLRGGSK